MDQFAGVILSRVRSGHTSLIIAPDIAESQSVHGEELGTSATRLLRFGTESGWGLGLSIGAQK